MRDSRAQDRALLEESAARRWGAPAIAAHTGFAPTYHVPGRRRDGTPRGVGSVRWLARTTAKTVHGIVALGASAVAPGPDPLWGPDSRSGHVRGADDSAAVRVTESMRGQFWLVVAPRGVGVARVHDNEIEMLWQDDGPDRPVFDDHGLRWPDGSSVSFVFLREEHRRLVDAWPRHP